MKILIASDSHRDLKFFYETVVNEKPDMVLFTGDHSNDAIETSYAFDIPFHIVKGNCDYFDYETPEMIELSIEKIGKVVLVHGHNHDVKSNMNKIYRFGKEVNADLVIFGHTHISHISEYEGITFLNPGAMCNHEYVILEEDNIVFKGGRK